MVLLNTSPELPFDLGGARVKTHFFNDLCARVTLEQSEGKAILKADLDGSKMGSPRGD